jgi:hypothetical protein
MNRLHTLLDLIKNEQDYYKARERRHRLSTWVSFVMERGASQLIPWLFIGL